MKNRMLPECKICWFCVYAKSERKRDRRGYIHYYRWCELGIKKIGAQRHVDFQRCKGFEPNPEAIISRENDLHRVIRECRTELAYLERLRVYAEHRRRRGAEYERVFGNCFEPLFPETGEENVSEGKTARACGFEEKEKRPDEGAGGIDEHI